MISFELHFSPRVFTIKGLPTETRRVHSSNPNKSTCCIYVNIIVDWFMRNNQ